jgi:hypothetical protein
MALNSAFTHSGVMYGRGKKTDQAKSLVAGLQRANTFAQDNKVVTKGRKVTDTLGLTKLLDKKTNGLYSQGTDFAISRGYGRRRKPKRR